MFILATKCGNCGTYCSREHDKSADVPKLYEFNIPFMTGFFCENCFRKIEKGMKKLYESFLKEEIL